MSPKNSNTNRCGQKRTSSYICRLCRQSHPLRKCKRFLSMNITKRKETVQKYGYCKNCLAHEHSGNACFTTTGCRFCKKDHHSLLHAHPRLQNTQRKNSSSSSSKKPSVKTEKPTVSSTPSTAFNSASTTLSAILKQNAVTLLPTALVSVTTKKGNCVLRCLLDSGSNSSSISSKIVDKLDLTTLTLEEETICPLTLISTHNSDISIDTVLKVNNRISMHTPSKSIPQSYVQHFSNLVLADKDFYKSAPISIILGVDVYSRIISEGFLNRSGLPTAQNTIFGWSIYGICPN
ncbi:uncharacterized protein LOC142240089 [Haematobia irritans]|uniref:uncharacterized protein LOC142240089 n=1 Tax=Haematobia irritans TaxID=7368 RepID=UPI003F503220